MIRQLLLAALALLYGLNGAFMVASPHLWDTATPGEIDTGPFNVQFVVDIGFIYLVTGAAFAVAAVRPSAPSPAPSTRAQPLHAPAGRR